MDAFPICLLIGAGRGPPMVHCSSMWQVPVEVSCQWCLRGGGPTGDTHVDQYVMEQFMKVFQKKQGKDMSKDKQAVQKLRLSVL